MAKTLRTPLYPLVLAVALLGCGGVGARDKTPGDTAPGNAGSAATGADAPNRAAGDVDTSTRPNAVLASTILVGDAAGRVILAHDSKLYPTAAAAREAAGRIAQPSMGRGHLGSYRVLANESDVVRVTTEPADARDADCAQARAPYEPRVRYAIEAFAPRTALVARLQQAMRVEHPDGTGAIAWAGAPVYVFPDGHGELFDVSLASLLGPVPRARIGLGWAHDASDGHSEAQWSRPLTPLVCDPGPVSLAEWQAHETERRDAATKKENEARAEREYRACLERKAHEPPPPPSKPGPLSGLSAGFSTTCENVRDSMLRSPGLGLGNLIGRGNLGASVPYCRLDVPEGERLLVSKVAGKPAVAVAELAFAERLIVAQGAREASFLVEVQRACGEVRVEVPASALARGGGGGAGGTGMMSQKMYYALKTSLVTWPDGAPAGKVQRSGPLRATELKEVAPGRLCHEVAPFAQPLCHAKDDLCETPDCKPRRGPG
jgi:hypothetical protein